MQPVADFMAAPRSVEAFERALVTILDIVGPPHTLGLRDVWPPDEVLDPGAIRDAMLDCFDDVVARDEPDAELVEVQRQVIVRALDRLVGMAAAECR